MLKSFKQVWVCVWLALACSSSASRYSDVQGGGGTDGTPGKGRDVGGSAGSTASAAGNGGSGADPAPIGGSSGTPNSGENAGAAGETSTCEPDACCIRGQIYGFAAKNPINPCQSCQPDVTTSAWTSRADNTECGDGCVCISGKRVEAVCSDLYDNDADDKPNCADPDCADKLCHLQDGEGKGFAATRDLSRSTIPGIAEVVDGREITLTRNSQGETYAVFEFPKLTADPAVTVHAAYLSVSVATNPLVGRKVSMQAKHPNSSSLDEVDISYGHSLYDLDITPLVQSWVNGSEDRQWVTLHRGESATQDVAVRTSEQGYVPSIRVIYEAKCTAQNVCPSP